MIERPITPNSVLLFSMAIFSLVFLAICGRARPTPEPPLFASTPPPPMPTLDASRIAQGQNLYAQHCAACHGPAGEGQPDWKIRRPDGSLPAPPHDSSGHTWHHGDALLVDLIANGSGLPQSQMPLFNEVLTEAEILAILEYIKTWWGPQERTFQWQVTWQAQQ